MNTPTQVFQQEPEFPNLTRKDGVELKQEHIQPTKVEMKQEIGLSMVK